MNSVSSPVDQPSSARKLRNASERKSFVAIGADAGGAVALGEARAIRAEDQRHVGEDRRRRAQGAIEQHLLRRVREMIRAADDVRDAHVDVVHHGAELIRRQRRLGGLARLRRAQQNEILDLFVGDFARAEDGVVESRDLAQRHAEAHGGRLRLIRGIVLRGTGSGSRDAGRPRRHRLRPRRRRRRIFPAGNSRGTLRRTRAIFRRRRGRAAGVRIGEAALRPNRGRASASRRGCLRRVPACCVRRRYPRFAESGRRPCCAQTAN